ncbi:FAEL337Cp [Eremothecium gossypii FDAG1]|nr:FAEL337Cp [Eremothecium gossypii FDAG1]
MASTVDLGSSLRQRDDDQDGDLASLAGHKRLRRNTVQYAHFQEGAIVSIRLTNFVTYSLAEFHMSPSLNMIIGPNGSGKSTFVCAICLGLAGKPEYIGRAKRVEDFIKNGTAESTIEIQLRNSRNVSGLPMISAEDEAINVRTVLMKARRKCAYYINGEPVSENQMRALVSMLNIQLDNLCQFLSQERVEEFARLKADKLLEQTVRSVDASLLGLLEQLKTSQQEELSLNREVELGQKKLEKLMTHKESLENQVRALEEYERKKEEIDIHKRLLPYVRVKNHKRQLKDLKSEYERVKQELKEFLKDKKPFKIASNALLSEVENSQRQKQGKESEYIQVKSTQRSLIEELGKQRTEVEDLKKKVTYYRTRRENIRRKVEKAEQDIASRQQLLGSLVLPTQEEMDNYEQQRVDLYEQESAFEQKVEEMDSKVRALNRELTTIKSKLERRKKELASNDSLNALRGQTGRLEEVKKACEFVRIHPEMKGKVLEPPIVAIKAPNERIASYLTTCIDWHTSISLTMVDSASYREFNDTILKNFQVNLRELANTETSYPYPLEYIRQLGFDCYLSDFVTGDPAVLQMLKEQQRIHTIPVSTRNLDTRIIDDLRTPDKQGRLKFRRVIAGDYVYDFKRSRYGNKQIFSTDVQVKKAQFYIEGGMSDGMKQNIERELHELRERYRNIQKEVESTAQQKKQFHIPLAEVQRKLQDLQKAIHEQNHKRIIQSRTMSEIQNIEQKLEEFRRDMNKDVSEVISNCEAQIQSNLISQGEQLRLIVMNLSRLQEAQESVVRMGIKHIELRNRERSLNEVIGFFNAKEEELRGKYDEAKKAYAEVKDTAEFQAWMKEIRSYTDTERDELSVWANKYEEQNTFTLENILETIAKLETEIQMINHDESSVTILRQTVTDIKGLQAKLPTQMERLGLLRRGMLDMRNNLEPRLDELVENISQRFRKLFSNVGSAGEICLLKPDLYSEWKIEIRVKFRDVAELKKLDSHTQSGGERAVSTVLYMIALQHFTNAPFRVVDEINQGMDTRNERIVHKAMVENACAENTSQYFLITPKLLTNLHYHERMRIHCVFAGSWIPDPAEREEMVHYGELTSYKL